MRCRRPLILASLVAAAGFSLLAAGCGSGGSPRAGVANLGTIGTAAAAPVNAGSSPGGELVEYARCMRSHGVSSFPDPAAFGSPGAIRAAKGQMAQISESKTSQQRSRPRNGLVRSTTARRRHLSHPSPQEMQRLLAVSRCMRAHGILSFPDPIPPPTNSRPSPGSPATPRKPSQPAEAVAH